MKQLQVPFIGEDVLANGLADASALFSRQQPQIIENLLWSSNGYRPDVIFFIAHTTNGILLKYMVEEQYVKADYLQVNDPVFKDSCVEAFIAFDNDTHYYNLEFNCIGTALVRYGKGKDDRTPVNKRLVENMTSFHTIQEPDTATGLIKWELTVNIPFSLFEHHHMTGLKNRVCRMNFYKCGDDLPEPHFLSWNNIDYPYPNFHLPEFFGSVEFMP